jgi:hypothetical protein
MSIIALLHSSDAIREKYTIIKRILDFGADRLIAIVNRCISDQFADVKGLLRHGLVARIDSLQQAAMGLPGYPEFASGTELSPAVGLPDELMTTTMRQDIDEDEDQDDEEGEDGGFLGNMALPQAPMTTGMSRDVEQRDDADEEEADEEANEKHHHSSSSESDENDAAKPAKKKRKGR